MLDLTKLARILRLLGSDKSGEVLSAAHATTKMLRSAGLDWEQILSPRSNLQSALSDEELLAIALAKISMLSTWEQGFIHSLERLLYRGHQLTEKQRNVLLSICEK
jgi:hypothetical protein